jgi:ABC-type branched-subunit amino acid transport system substrate-binding protein
VEVTSQRTYDGPGDRERRRLRAAHSPRYPGLAIALALFVAACGMGAPGSPTSGASEPIKIGILADLTGPFTTYGTSLANSAQLAIKEINAKGGIAGRQITVIVEDTQTDVSATVDKARKLVQSDKVDLVMGPIGSDANDATYKTVVEEGSKLLFYTETFEGGKCNELYFSFGAVPAQQIRPLIPVLQEEYGPKVMLFGADYVWPRRSFEIAKPIIAENGGSVVAELYLPLIAEDFSELVRTVRETQPDYIFSLYPAVWGSALKALDDADLLGTVVPTSQAWRISPKARTRRCRSSRWRTLRESSPSWMRTRPASGRVRSPPVGKGLARTTPCISTRWQSRRRAPPTRRPWPRLCPDSRSRAPRVR